MANIQTTLFTLLKPAFLQNAPLSAPVEGLPDRIDLDLIGLSDTDAMWYYERRKWQGRD